MCSTALCCQDRTAEQLADCCSDSPQTQCQAVHNPSHRPQRSLWAGQTTCQPGVPLHLSQRCAFDCTLLPASMLAPEATQYVDIPISRVDQTAQACACSLSTQMQPVCLSNPSCTPQSCMRVANSLDPPPAHCMRALSVPHTLQNV